MARRAGDGGQYYGPAIPLGDLGLIASEGRLTIPVEDRSAAGVLAVHAVFFEFIPEDRIDEPAPPTLLAHELKDGARYYIIPTGSNGLYRYDLNDIVEVRGFYQWVVGDQVDPGPSALLIQLCSTDLYRMFYPGGAFSLETALFWALRSRDDRDDPPSAAMLARGVAGFPRNSG